jgi:hypothetical protein
MGLQGDIGSSPDNAYAKMRGAVFGLTTMGGHIISLEESLPLLTF